MHINCSTQRSLFKMVNFCGHVVLVGNPNSTSVSGCLIDRAIQQRGDVD